MGWTCLECDFDNEEDIPLFGDDAICKNCGAIHETDWDYIDEDSMTSWIVGIKKDG